MKPNGKCFAKNCEDCNFLYNWDMKNKEGLRANKKRCLFSVIGEEIPRIVGSVDGVQKAANESRNRSMEAKEIAQNFGAACARAFNSISDGIKLLK